jgi:hypothetical protein
MINVEGAAWKTVARTETVEGSLLLAMNVRAILRMKTFAM